MSPGAENTDTAKRLSRGKRFVVGALAVMALGILAFWTTLHRALVPSPEGEIVLESAEQASAPIQISIPDLGVDAKVVKVSITAKDAVAAPPSFGKAGWYEFGPAPGEPGLSLIDGHVNNGLGLNGVFYNLGDIEQGEDIFIEDTAGATHHFVVYATTTVSYESRLEDITSLGGKSGAELAIVTCEGNWLKSQRTYDARLVVLAKLIRS